MDFSLLDIFLKLFLEKRKKRYYYYYYYYYKYYKVKKNEGQWFVCLFVFLEFSGKSRNAQKDKEIYFFIYLFFYLFFVKKFQRFFFGCFRKCFELRPRLDFYKAKPYKGNSVVLLFVFPILQTRTDTIPFCKTNFFRFFKSSTKGVSFPPSRR